MEMKKKNVVQVWDPDMDVKKSSSNSRKYEKEWAKTRREYPIKCSLSQRFHCNQRLLLYDKWTAGALFSRNESRPHQNAFFLVEVLFSAQHFLSLVCTRPLVHHLFHTFSFTASVPPLLAASLLPRSTQSLFEHPIHPWLCVTMSNQILTDHDVVGDLLEGCLSFLHTGNFLSIAIHTKRHVPQHKLLYFVNRKGRACYSLFWSSYWKTSSTFASLKNHMLTW